jgi:hypothetical protein
VVVHDNSDSIDNDLHEKLDFEHPTKEEAEQERNTATL